MGWKDIYCAILAAAAEEAIERASQTYPPPYLYLYYLPGTATDYGKVQLAENAPGPEWKLGWSQALPRTMEYTEYLPWITERCDGLPLLPSEEN